MFIQAGAQAPECIEFSVTNAALAAEPLDLTGVTGVVVRVQRPDGRRVVWAADITVKTAVLLTLRHTFALDDVRLAGSYGISIDMTVAAGIRRAGPTVIEVRS